MLAGRHGLCSPDATRVRPVRGRRRTDTARLAREYRCPQAWVLGIRVIRMILAVPIVGPIAVAFGACTRHGIDFIQ